MQIYSGKKKKCSVQSVRVLRRLKIISSSPLKHSGNRIGPGKKFRRETAAAVVRNGSANVWRTLTMEAKKKKNTKKYELVSSPAPSPNRSPLNPEPSRFPSYDLTNRAAGRFSANRNNIATHAHAHIKIGILIENARISM